MAKKYDQEVLDKIIRSVDNELSDSFSFGRDDLSDVRREYLERFYRIGNDGEEEANNFSTYRSPLIQNHVLQSRAAILRPFTKSKGPIAEFPDIKSTTYINHLFRYELPVKGKSLLSDLAFNGLLLKTMGVKTYVKKVREVEAGTETFIGDSKKDVEDQVDAFLAEDEDLELIGDIDWDEEEVTIEAYSVDVRQYTPEQAPQGAPAPVEPPVEPLGAPQEPLAFQEGGLVPQDGQPVQETFLEPQQQELTDEVFRPEVEISEEPVDVQTETRHLGTIKWQKIIIKKKACLDVIPPYETYVTRQAPDINFAAAKGRVTPMKIGDMRLNYPDAHKINNYEGDEDTFWSEMIGEWIGWTQQNEWYTLWEKDNSSYYDGYHFVGSQNYGEPASAVLVSDVEIDMDLYDEGFTRKYNVIKAGNRILSCEEISMPCFHFKSLIQIAGRWLGYGVADMIWDEDTEVTNQIRAAQNAILDASYPTPVVDTEQVILEDVLGRQPGSVVRRKINTVPKQGVSAIDWMQANGPAGDSFGMIDKLQQFASVSTGAGQGFAGFEADNASSSRLSGDTAKIIENNSDLMLDEMSTSFWEFIEEVLVMLHNHAVVGGASPIVIHAAGEDGQIQEFQIDPRKHLKPVKAAQMNLIIGSGAETEHLDKATEILRVITELEAFPTLANIITPDGKALALGNLFKELGVDQPEQYLEAANADPMQSPEVQQAIQQAQEAAMQQAQQQIEEYKNSDERRMKLMAHNSEIELNWQKFGLEKEGTAAEHAYKFQLSEQGERKIDAREDEFAATHALNEEKLDLDRENSDREYELAKKPDPVRTEL